MLPVITETALSVCNVAIALPIIWMVVSALVYRFIKRQKAPRRNEYLLAFTAITVVVGFSLLLFFELAGILPYLRIGAFIL